MKQSGEEKRKKLTNMRDSADLTITLALAIRSRRRTLKLTQEDLSDMSDVSLRLIHEVEHGKDSIQLGKLIKILNSLGMHLELRVGATEQISIDPAIAQLARERT